MATINIYISRNGQSNNIKVRDSEGHDPGNDNITTDVSPGDTVIWQLDSNSGLTSLDGITRTVSSDHSFDPNAVDLLVSTPSGSNSVFTGTVVSTSPGRGKYEKYKIGYTVPGTIGTQWDDPKLQINQ